jgi:transcription antitermination factor NusG
MKFTPKQWYAFYCKSRAEKRVNELLLRDKYEAYLPLKTEMRQWSDRKKKVKLPLLPGYIFVRCAKKEVQQIVKCPNVLAIVNNLNDYAIISETEINRLRVVADGGYEVMESCPDFSKGDTVLIKTGVFKGCEAIISDKAKSARVCVHLASIDVNFTLVIHQSQLGLV